MSDPSGSVKKKVGSVVEGISYDESKKMAESTDLAVRRSLAEREDIRPELLYYLAMDEEPEVRRAIALNAATPPQADRLLAEDKSDEVRLDLAGKVAALAPELDPENLEKAQSYVLETVKMLVKDQQSKVRQIVAESVKELENIPHSIVQQLAADTDEKVCCPILQYSPILTDDDLLNLIHAGMRGTRLKAVSRRANLGEEITDAIVETDDHEAIATLLDNHSAQVREETLDRLIEQAPSVPMWHKPLVKRPKLSLASMQRLASFVTEDLLEELEKKTGLDPAMAEAVGKAVRQRMAGEQVVVDDNKAKDAEEQAKLEREVKYLHNAGKLTEERITTRLHCGDREFSIHALAELAGIPVQAARRMVLSRAPKTVIALVWRAGCSVELASLVQLRLAGIPPHQMLRADPSGDFPVPEKELDWQVTLYTEENG